MKRFAIILALSSLNATLPALGQRRCDIAVLGSVEAHNPDLSLADLLAPDTCPVVLSSASQVSLGKAPLTGSMRVFENNRIRALVERVVKSLPTGTTDNAAVSVPERVIVRRNSRLTCADIANRFFPGASRIDCTVADRIPREAALEVARRTWDPATRNWDFVIRCSRPGECVPFLARVPGGTGVSVSPHPPEGPRSEMERPDGRARVPAQERVLVHRGESATVVWDQQGVRAEVQVICLDEGREGELVRVRIEHTARILRAVVLSQGRLRLGS